MKKHYSLYSESKQSIEELNNWLLENANIICWTNYPDSWFQIIGLTSWEKDSRFQKMMKKFEPYFIEKTIDNLEYGEIHHNGKNKFSHYFFKIEGKVKEFILKEGPIATSVGFWDPIYYRDQYMIANTIGHEGIVNISESI